MEIQIIHVNITKKTTKKFIVSQVLNYALRYHTYCTSSSDWQQPIGRLHRPQVMTVNANCNQNYQIQQSYSANKWSTIVSALSKLLLEITSKVYQAQILAWPTAKPLL